MRKYEILKEEKIEKVFCNHCGKEIPMEQGRPLRGSCQINIAWDYFSNKDTEKHSFDLCEPCYDQWVASFTIPVTVKEENELL